LKIYLNKPLRQVKTMKYLGIIDSKLTFREHITQATEKCRKIFALSKSAKLNWGLGHKALKTLYTGGFSLSSYTGHRFGRKQ